MTDQSRAPDARNARYWVGWALSGLVIAFMLMDATMKLMALPIVTQSNGTLGFQGANMARELGVMLLAGTVLYAAPRTAVFGAILLTGYLGGSVAAHLRVGDPLFSHVLFGVYLGVMLWGGLWFRDARLRALMPFREAERAS